MAGNPRHPAVITLKTGVKSDGRLWARQATAIFNSGAYGSFKPRVYLGGADRAGGPYVIPHVNIDGYMVYTNNVPCGHMRAPAKAPGDLRGRVSHGHDCPGNGSGPLRVPIAQRAARRRHFSHRRELGGNPGRRNLAGRRRRRRLDRPQQAHPSPPWAGAWPWPTNLRARASPLPR